MTISGTTRVRYTMESNGARNRGDLETDEDRGDVGRVVQAGAEPAGGEPVPDRDVADLGGRDAADAGAVEGGDGGRRRPVEGEDRHHQDRQVQEGVHYQCPGGEPVLGPEALTHRTAPLSWRTG